MRRLSLLLLLISGIPGYAADGNRLVHLDQNNPYHVSRSSPRLTTPQWVGEEAVEAVVILAIDDMRGHAAWETFLRPILNRLKKIDGRAPVSIMTCTVDPKHPHLQTWLKEGLSFEAHTIDHPCPLLRGGDLPAAKSTVDRCIDLLNEVPGNRPVAFRMPCCDSLNTLSPRFFSEIFNATTPKKNFLELDSSVFNVFTPDDPEIPREVFRDGGPERFRRYLPLDRSFVNWIENYCYPYVINRLCWEFPCLTPSDWEGNHLHGKSNPITARDWMAALDAVVAKKGTLNLVFHPHGWCKAEQVIDLIDHAVTKYGKKVKFLTFREARDRLTKNALGGVPLRAEDGSDNGVRLLDLDGDGFMDVLIGNARVKQTRLWSPAMKTWIVSDTPVSLTGEPGVRFGVLHPDGRPSLLVRSDKVGGAWQFHDGRWVEDRSLLDGLELDGKPIPFADKGRDRGVRLRDLDGDGVCELIVGNATQNAVFRRDAAKRKWVKLPFALPEGVALVDAAGRDQGLRFVDIDDDGFDDIVFANEKRYAVHLFASLEKGWNRKGMEGKGDAQGGIPPITRNGTDNGMWIHSRHLWWQNEHTNLLQHHVDRRSFHELETGVEPGPKSPQVSLRLMQTRPGFTVELMAAEPLVQDPISLAWGSDGKLWVVEMGDYPLGIDAKGKYGGRVKYLEDSKGNGKYDKVTVFLDGLPFPTSVIPWRKGVLITAAPDILYAEDTKGTGKADVVKKLFTGFVQGNQQHRVNTLAWGLDGWIYGANGDSGGQIKSTQTGKVVNISGRDFRFRPDTGEFEAQTGQTQYGRSRDDWGNWFGNNNSNPLWHFALEDHYLRRNPHLAPPPPIVHIVPGPVRVFPISRTLPRFNDPGGANRFTSACSPTIYRDDLFGPAFAGNAFISEPVHNLVHRQVLSPSGVSFQGRRADDEQTSEFLSSRDNWFRPTTIRTGPDGAIWVADMYRHVIEHPQWIPADWQKRLDLRAGHEMGRIYRVYPTDKKPRAIPRLDKLDLPQLVAALDSPSGWQRDMVQMMLLWKKDRDSIPMLEKLALDSPHPLTRLHAVCTLNEFPALEAKVLRKVLNDEHPGVRRQAISFTEERMAWSREFATELLARVKDPDPLVRMQLAYTLGFWNDPRAAQALGQLAVREANERRLLTAVLSSVSAKNIDAVLTAVLSESKTAPPPAALIDRLLRLASSFDRPDTVASLLAAVGTPEKGQYAPWQYTALSGLLDALEARGASLTSMAKSADDRLKESLRRVEGLFRAARVTVVDPQASPAARVQAASLLGRGTTRQTEDRELLAGLLTPQSPDEVQQAAIGSLVKLQDARVTGLLLRGWKSHSPALRVSILEGLLQRDEGAKAILDAIEKKEVLPADVDAIRRQRLLQYRNDGVRKRAEKLFAGSLDPDRQKVIDAYRAVLILKGDAERGRTLFTKNCAACHKLAGVGNEVGPDLGSLSDRSSQTLLIAVLDPNRAVEARYLQYQATTTSGKQYSGVLTSETSTSVTLSGADGKPVVILRRDLESLTSTGKSPMPDGLEKELKPQDLADVFEFVRGAAPLPQRKVFDGNKPELVRPAADGSLKLTAANAEIHGKTLVFEPQFGNLGWWSSEDDQAAWEVDVPKAGKYAVEMDWACHANTAGNRYQLQTADGRLTGTVASTGVWETYRQGKIGELMLKAGKQRLIIRSEGKINGALIDLRSLRLTPVP